MEDFSKSLWLSQNIWTLSPCLVLSTFSIFEEMISSKISFKWWQQMGYGLGFSSFIQIGHTVASVLCLQIPKNHLKLWFFFQVWQRKLPRSWWKQCQTWSNLHQISPCKKSFQNAQWFGRCYVIFLFACKKSTTYRKRWKYEEINYMLL